ncbi:MAG: hypothetical protein NTU44_03480 [Bacteroidetes bacterium]|nr:hypothetical protein [Bacteroidota bacterium]
MIHYKGIVQDEEQRQAYIAGFCTHDEKKWEECKRFKTNAVLHFCPDFVLPDTSLNLEEIMDRFDVETTDQQK